MKTNCRLTTLLVSLVLSFAEVPRSDGELEQHQCNELGFTSVSCSTCKRFEEIVADESLTDECLQCCQEAKSSSKKYASAKLVYDPRWLSADPELRGFVNDRATDHPALELEPTLYAKTVLLMSEEGADADDVDVINIKRWKVDSIADYLNEHLDEQ
ncbi:unnamed protein product [Ectocarpus sp. CCAP 1310/34]|nr:unnamed protein product [Ectocarpus sp. CCAP 1310/34]